MKRALSIVLLFCALGCGNSSSMSPSSPYPYVVGNYSGSVSITFPALGALTCLGTTSVAQSGATVSIAPLLLGGSCSGLVPSLPIGDAAIMTTGSFGPAVLSNLYVASCNGYYNAVIGGGFFGSSLGFSIVYTAASGGCVKQVGNVTLSATLTKS
jgi:hypothetical protein